MKAKPRVSFIPEDVTVEVGDGVSLLEVARNAGYTLRSECGGQGTCRRCKVRLLAGDVHLTGDPNLTEKEKQDGYILACIAHVIDDIEVEIPRESELVFEPGAIKSEITPGEHPGNEVRSRGYKFNPSIKSISVSVRPPTLKDNSSDLDRLYSELKKQVPSYLTVDLPAMQSLSTTLRKNKESVNVAIFNEANLSRIIAIDSPETTFYGIAVDIGTTTVFVRLIDLQTGDVIGEASDFNGQISSGGDIIHRIVFASKKGGLQKLRQQVLKTIDQLIESLLSENGIAAGQVVTSIISGNTTMEHLFLGLDPKTIREEPYVPTVTQFPTFRATEAELPINPSASVLLTPSVASYVGGDITAGILAAGIHRSEKLTLYVDLGTNGEVALGNSEWLTACACSAGPAFEGSGVRCGMRALNGGINKVTTDPKDATLLFETIGGGTPYGICGSGMIDLLAELRATNRITAHGKFNQEADPSRIRKTGRRSEIVLVSKSEKNEADIVVTEPDIDNLIRTKGAIFAGIRTLLKGVGLETGEIERVVVAGSFGRHLNIENAIRIGMLPDLPLNRFEYIGNGSLRGAGLAMLSNKLWEEMHEIASMVTYFELSTWPGYMDEFMASLFLPHTDLSLFPSLVKPKKK